MGRAILNHTWENTAIGPMEYWSPTLRSMVALILSSPYRMRSMGSPAVNLVMMIDRCFLRSLTFGTSLACYGAMNV